MATTIAHRSIARRREAAATRRALIKAALFASPWIIGFLCFTLYPALTSLYYSFTHYDLINPPRWVGLANYQYLFTQDMDFRNALGNTLYMAIIGVPLGLLVAFGAAMLLNTGVRGMAFWRTAYFLPTLMPPVAATILWLWIFNPQVGVVNTVFSLFHANSPGWFTDPDWSKPALIMLGLWQIGTTTIIYLAGLQNVPKELYEAAELDGAGPWAKVRYVTVPMVSSVTLFNLIIGVIGMFQYFTNAFIVGVSSGGGSSSGVAQGGSGAPAGSLLFYAVYLYNQAFGYLHMGYASAMAWVLLTLILVVTLIILRSSSRWTYYEGQGR